MIPLGPVVARARVRAQRAVVWNHLIDPALRERWWPTAELDAALGGSVGDGSAAGDVDVFVEGHALGFRWAERAADAAGAADSAEGSADASGARSTAVLFTLRAQGVDTGVTVTETGFDALPQAAERAAAATERWQGLLAALVAAVDDFDGSVPEVAAGAAALGAAASDASEPAADAEPAETSEDDDASADTVMIAQIAVPDRVIDEVVAEGMDGAGHSGGSDVTDQAAEAGGDRSADAGGAGTDAVDPAADTAANTAANDASGDADEDPDAGIVPLVLPGPPGEQQDADDAAEEEEEESLTGDPDFDALIRGDSLE